MKYLMILWVGVCLLFTSVPAVADQAEDEAAIREAYEEFIRAFNKNDAKAIADLQDESFEYWEGEAKGKAGAEKEYENRFKNQKGLHVKLLDEIGIVFVTPAVALHKMRCEVSNRSNAKGEALPPIKYLVANVFVKRDGQWLRAAYFSSTIEE